jgi:hypothetical protein
MATKPRFFTFLPRHCRNFYDFYRDNAAIFSHLGLSRYRDFWPSLPRQNFAPGSIGTGIPAWSWTGWIPNFWMVWSLGQGKENPVW